VTVKLVGDITGVSPSQATTDCSALAYGPVARPTAAPERSKLPTRFFQGVSLPLHEKPGVPAFTMLSDQHLRLHLQIVAQQHEFSQVRFETEFARFDVWVESRRISSDGGLSGSSGSGACGRTSRGGRGPVHRVLETSPITVGARPTAGPSSGVFIGRGTSVAITGREAGFVSVHVNGARIQPPEGQAFWIPEALVEQPTRPRAGTSP
jgi:hypothetical protein